MTRQTTAIVENGGLKLVEPLEGIPEHSIVRVAIEIVTPPPREAQLAMLCLVPVAEELAAAIEAGRRKKWIPEEF